MDFGREKTRSWRVYYRVGINAGMDFGREKTRSGRVYHRTEKESVHRQACLCTDIKFQYILYLYLRSHLLLYFYAAGRKVADQIPSVIPSRRRMQGR